jgi:hypothetical protein
MTACVAGEESLNITPRPKAGGRDTEIAAAKRSLAAWGTLPWTRCNSATQNFPFLTRLITDSGSPVVVVAAKNPAHDKNAQARISSQLTYFRWNTISLLPVQMPQTQHDLYQRIL